MLLSNRLAHIIARETGERVPAADMPFVGAIVRKMLRHPLPLPQKVAAFVRAVKLNREMPDTEARMLAIWQENVPEIIALREIARDVLLSDEERKAAMNKARSLRRKTLAAHQELEDAYHRLAVTMRANAASRFLPKHDPQPIFTTDTLDALTRVQVPA
jgi:hypothetical protein